MDKCKNCIHYYINYYINNMPPSCRYLKKVIDDIDISDCDNFILKSKSFEEVNSLDSFMKHFRDMNE